jgi:hypothetical protein
VKSSVERLVLVTLSLYEYLEIIFVKDYALECGHKIIPERSAV